MKGNKMNKTTKIDPGAQAAANLLADMEVYRNKIKIHFATGDIPEGYVGPLFTMNPETEDLIRGTQLEEGMIVLIHDPTNRYEDPKKYENVEVIEPYGHARLLREGRWCKVTEIFQRRESDVLQFIGLYSDGTKHNRMYNESWCWYVKTDPAVEIDA
jgi:hypothetical protein